MSALWEYETSGSWVLLHGVVDVLSCTIGACRPLYNQHPGSFRGPVVIFWEC
jgi:hypothetical protein